MNIDKNKYEVFNDDGHIILRGSDDGGKLCYPKNELLQELLIRYDKLVSGFNDRFNGRKLYSLLSDTGYVNISMLYRVADTCENTRHKKTALFQTAFSFRTTRLKSIKEKYANDKKIQQEVDGQLSALEELEKLFSERDFGYCNTSYIAIASLQ